MYSTICPLCSGFPSPKTDYPLIPYSLHLSLRSVILRLTPSILLCILLRVTSGSRSRILHENLFPAVFFVYLNYHNGVFFIFLQIKKYLNFRVSVHR